MDTPCHTPVIFEDEWRLHAMRLDGLHVCLHVQRCTCKGRDLLITIPTLVLLVGQQLICFDVSQTISKERGFGRRGFGARGDFG
jgi:hypothetical protein